MDGWTRLGVALVAGGCAIGAALGVLYGAAVCLVRLLEGAEEPCP